MTGHNITALADKLGDIKAEIAELKKTEKALVSALVDFGETVEGERFIATYVPGSAPWVLDKAKIEADPEIDDEWIRLHSKITNRKPTVRVTRKLAA